MDKFALFEIESEERDGLETCHGTKSYDYIRIKYPENTKGERIQYHGQMVG